MSIIGPAAAGDVSDYSAIRPNKTVTALVPVSHETGSTNSNKENGSRHVWGSIVAGVAIGVVVGGGLALLFAPKAGAHVRTDLGGAVDDLKDRAEQVIDDLQESASDLVARSRDVLDRTRENLARSVEAGRDTYRQTKHDLSAQLEAEA